MLDLPNLFLRGTPRPVAQRRAGECLDFFGQQESALDAVGFARLGRGEVPPSCVRRAARGRLKTRLW